MGEFITFLVIVLVVVGGFMAYKSSKEETAEARTVKSLPPSIQHVVVQMDGGSQAAFFNEYESKKKKKSVGYLLWFFFGWHYLYVGKVGLQFAYWFTVGGFGFWIIADFFRMPSIIRSANEQIARQALQTLHIGTAFASVAQFQNQQYGNVPQGYPGQAGAFPIGAAQPQTQNQYAVAQTQVTPVVQNTGSWAADPTGRHQQRYYDGAQWTDHVSTNGVTGVDPIGS